MHICVCESAGENLEAMREKHHDSGPAPARYHRGTRRGDAAPPELQGRNVTDSDSPDIEDIDKFDPGLTQRLMAVMRPFLTTYFRSEVRGLNSFPPGGALVVGNHSGGMFPMDVPIFSAHFYQKFGYDRAVYTLSHDILFMGPTGPFFRRTGYIRANRENAAKALQSGGVVVVFPGGDYDAYRPTLSENVIDFNGRKGYISTAIEAGVPIVPAVSIGGQETQLYLTRGTWLAERLGIKRLLRSAILPLSFGFPFGLSAVIPPNVPLPTKIVTQVLEPIDIVARFGEDPDVDEVDQHVRSVMQQALSELAAKRRFPILG
jgi:1-acyl-sn-glycerol-3-phosphate acyltransferase